MDFVDRIISTAFVVLAFSFIRSLIRGFTLSNSFDVPHNTTNTTEGNTSNNIFKSILIKTKRTGIAKLTEEQFLTRAQTASKNNLHATAATFYTKAIQLNPNPNHYMYRAVSNSLAFNLRESIEDVDVAIALVPNNSFYYKFKGDLLMRALKVPEAIKAYKRAHELGEEGVGYIINNLQQRKSAWLSGGEYLDHFYIEYWREYYTTKNEMEQFKTKLVQSKKSLKQIDSIAMQNMYEESITLNQKITYLNMSSYKLFLN